MALRDVVTGRGGRSELTPIVRRYAIGVGASGAVLVPWLLLGQRVAPTFFLIFLIAVIISAWFGGLGPALLTSLIGLVASPTVHTVTRGSDSSHILAGIQLGFFVLVAVLVAALSVGLRRLQRNLRHQRDLTSAVTSNLGEGICATDIDGLITFINVAAERMLGRREGEGIGMDIDALLCGAKRPDAPWRAEPPEPASGDDLFTRRDGSSFPVGYTCSPLIVEGNVTGTVIAFRDMTKNREAEEALRRSEEQYRSLVETSPDAIIVTDRYGYIIMVNDRAAAIYGYADRDEMLERSELELLAPDDRTRALDDRRKLSQGVPLQSVEYVAVRKDGSSFPLEMTASLIRDESGQPQTQISIARDITQRRQAELERAQAQESLQESRAWLELQYSATKVLVEAATLGEAISILLQMICDSHNWETGVFWTAAEGGLERQSIWSRPGSHIAPSLDDLEQMALDTGLPWNAGRENEPLWLSEDAAHDVLRAGFALPVFAGGHFHSVLAFFSRGEREADREWTDAIRAIGAQLGQYVERRQAEDALAHQAMHDSLTGLPNRSLLQDRLQRAIVTTRRYNQPLALLLLDLDRFKEINDTFGHHYGDAVLREVAVRLRDALRESDTVARLGGDEFAVVLPRADRTSAAAVAEKIVNALAVPCMVEQRSLDIGCSIGIALCPEHGKDATALLKCADIAMYATKRARSGWGVYEVGQDQNSPERLSLISSLRHAIDRSELALYYQPKMDLRHQAIDSVEALLRWHHTQHGLITPDRIIPLAEESGLIRPLGRWVLEEAIRQCRAWYDAGLNLRVGVNLSAHNLHDPDLPGQIEELLHQWKVPPFWLEVEVTESMVMADPMRVIANLNQLHGLGISIAIDDFGTGYSSLTYLKRLPADQIKIDKSFVLDMVSNEDDAFIARSVIDLGHNLNLLVVAEGVENRETWDMLADGGCDLVQGFYLSKPMPAQSLTDWLRTPRDVASKPA